MSRLGRVLRASVVVLVVLALLALGVGTWTVRRSFPQVSGEVAVPGIEASVLRDGFGVPHVYAASLEQLLAAQAYVHAQDRFWEMDVRRHTTAGRLSELFGESQVDIDRFIRTLGWRRTAEAELALVSDETRRALEAYAGGVNAWLAQRGHTSEMSLEYAVLGLQSPGYEPQAWDAADSLAWLKAMAWDLRGNMETEITRALLAAEGPSPERIEQLYPTYPYDRHQTIVAGGEVVDGRWVPAEGDRVAAAADTATVAFADSPEIAPMLTRLSHRVAALPDLLGPSGAGLGSNSWVVAGELTATGEPMLANDPHLGPSLPSLWYQVGLHCAPVTEACPYDVVGYSFSGVPGVVIGHNDRIAWGFTNMGADVSDLYVERIDGDRYQVDGEWRDMEVLTETIAVAGGEPVEHTVRLTEHGPLLSDVSDQLTRVAGASPVDGREGGTGHGIALRWTALEPGRTADAILALNTARDFSDFRAAAALFEVPAQNLVYADVDGHIGFQAPGRVPVRSGYDGRWPVAGWDSDNDWETSIPFEELPYELDPERGYIVTANEAVVGPDYPYHLTDEWAYGYRGQRIADLIEAAAASGPIELAALAEIQADDWNGNAAQLVEVLLAVDLSDDRVAEARQLLAGWDLHQDRDSAAGAYFQAVWVHLLARTFHDELPAGQRPGGDSRWFEVVRQLVTDPHDRWWDDVRTERVEDRDDVLTAAMEDASEELRDRLGDDPAGWRWGELHTLDLTHQTLGTSGVAPIEAMFNRGPIETAGGKSIVNATGFDAAQGYAVDWVPSLRMLVDLADFDASRWIHLTGQSGHAFHPNYLDQTPLWQDNETVPMWFSRDAVEASTTDTLDLVPDR